MAIFLLPPKLFKVPLIGSCSSAELPDKSITEPFTDIKELISKYSRSELWCPFWTIY